METTTTTPTLPTTTAAADTHQHAPGAVHVHVVPPRLLLTIYAALLVLTILTVAVTGINLGKFNIWLALAVAVVKAALVAMYFMHLRWDAPFNGIILIVSLVFVALFIGIAVMDSKEYKSNYEPPQGAQVGQTP